MRNIVAVLLVLTMAMGLVLSGCGKPGAKAKDKDTGKDLTQPLELPQGGLDPGKAPSPSGKTG